MRPDDSFHPFPLPRPDIVPLTFLAREDDLVPSRSDGRTRQYANLRQPQVRSPLSSLTFVANCKMCDIF
ncbi:hypothetical protein CEXT_612961 [Caerostris extrusa]|uniref:Uncharacterized protein n=1 Tax=Caerostris extrusa TaxID=172846 RepID=A0AAV4V1Q1_CAEEX|nr:hypothetical protein CEXT_612961 [Caerostris extrusa]